MSTYPDKITRAELAEAIELLKKAASAADKQEFVLSLVFSGMIQAKIIHYLIRGKEFTPERVN